MPACACERRAMWQSDKQTYLFIIVCCNLHLQSSQRKCHSVFILCCRFISRYNSSRIISGPVCYVRRILRQYIQKQIYECQNIPLITIFQFADNLFNSNASPLQTDLSACHAPYGPSKASDCTHIGYRLAGQALYYFPTNMR